MHSIVIVPPRNSAQTELLNVTPSMTAQVIPVPVGSKGYGPVKVAPVTADIDPNIVSENIRAGVSILGVTGSAQDEYNSVVDLENIMRGTAETESESIETACNNISQFLYGE